MRLSKNRTYILVIIIVLIASVIGFRLFSATSNSKKTETAQVKKGTLEEAMTISGSIDADERVALQFQTIGKITWIGVKEGDFVKKYQSLATLDQRQLQKTLKKYLNTYIKTRDIYDQASKDTYKDQVVTDAIKRIIDENQSDLNNSVLDVEIQSLSIELANLSSPIDGVVTRVTMPVAGQNISLPSQEELDIVNPETVYFLAVADQDEVVKLKEGMSGSLTLDSYPDATISGVIRNISFAPKTDETGTVYKVKFTFPGGNSDYKYRLGMTGDLSFITKSKTDVLSVPTKFIISDKDKKYVRIKRNGKDMKVEVTTGMETDTDTELTSGVVAGDTVYD